MVARARWAFQVSQGSVFRGGGKRLYDFVANLFTKLRNKFHHNRPSIIEDIMKNILVSFFPRAHNIEAVVWFQQQEERYTSTARARRSSLVVKRTTRSCSSRRLIMVACGSAAVWRSTTATSDVSWTSGRSSTRGVLAGGLVTSASRPSLTVCLTTRSLVHATSADISRPATSASKVCKVLELHDAVHLFCRPPEFDGTVSSPADLTFSYLSHYG